MAPPRFISSQPCLGSAKLIQRASPGDRIGADAVQVRPPSAVANTLVRLGVVPWLPFAASLGTASQAPPAAPASRTRPPPPPSSRRAAGGGPGIQGPAPPPAPRRAPAGPLRE